MVPGIYSAVIVGNGDHTAVAIAIDANGNVAGYDLTGGNITGNLKTDSSGNVTGAITTSGPGYSLLSGGPHQQFPIHIPAAQIASGTVTAFPGVTIGIKLREKF